MDEEALNKLFTHEKSDGGNDYGFTDDDSPEIETIIINEPLIEGVRWEPMLDDMKVEF